MNILASTSRQWNCGDEFILFGIQRLIESVCPSNWLIYDRNPDLLAAGGAKRTNAWIAGSLRGINLVIVAGSPEWSGMNLAPLCRAANEQEVPIVYLGIGNCGWAAVVTDDDRRSLARARLTTCRDQMAFDQLQAMGLTSSLLPCPAIFAAAHAPLDPAGPTGFCFQLGRTRNQSVKSELMIKAVAMIEDALDHGENVRVIAHYRDEYLFAVERGWPVRYSYDARDYAAFYAGCSHVVSTRLHGAILSYGMGIPTTLINRDARCAASAEQFPGMRVTSVADALSVDYSWIRSCADRYAETRRAAEADYLRLLGERCGDLLDHRT